MIEQCRERVFRTIDCQKLYRVNAAFHSQFRQPTSISGLGSAARRAGDVFGAVCFFVRDCLDAAAHCEKRAASASDRTTQATFAEAARCWREIAQCWRELPKHSFEAPPYTAPDRLIHRDYQTGMYIGAHRAPCRPVEKSNNEDSVNFFVAHREWLLPRRATRLEQINKLFGS